MGWLVRGNDRWKRIQQGQKFQHAQHGKTCGARNDFLAGVRRASKMRMFPRRDSCRPHHHHAQRANKSIHQLVHATHGFTCQFAQASKPRVSRGTSWQMAMAHEARGLGLRPKRWHYAKSNWRIERSSRSKTFTQPHAARM